MRRPLARFSLLALLTACTTIPSGRDGVTKDAARAAQARYSDQDRALLWEEAIFTFNGLAYTYRGYVFPTERAAQSCHDKLATCRQASFTWQETNIRYNEIPLALRERIAVLSQTEMSSPFPAPKGGWMVIELLKQTPSRFVGAVDPPRWMGTFAASALPSPQDLRSDPALVVRGALNRVRNREDLARALAEKRIDPTQLDQRTSSGWTLLVKAIYLGDLELMEALLANGAHPDACGLTACPLTTAALNKNRDAVLLLLRWKADPNGVGSDSMTPLMAASVNADREMAQMLLQAGADPLRSRTEAVGGTRMLRSTLYYAGRENREYLQWLGEVVRQALIRTHRYGWSAWVEQGGKRAAVTDRGTITLRRAPFKVILHMNGQAGFRVAASEDTSLLERSQDIAFRRDLFSGARVGAADAHSKFLSVSPLTMEGEQLHWSVHTTDWSYREDLRASTGTTYQPRNGTPEYVHEVEELVFDKRTVPLTRYEGPGLAMVMGALPPLGTGSDLFDPLRVTVRFRK